MGRRRTRTRTEREEEEKEEEVGKRSFQSHLAYGFLEETSLPLSIRCTLTEPDRWLNLHDFLHLLRLLFVAQVFVAGVTYFFLIWLMKQGQQW